MSPRATGRVCQIALGILLAACTAAVPSGPSPTASAGVTRPPTVMPSAAIVTAAAPSPPIAASPAASVSATPGRTIAPTGPAFSPAAVTAAPPAPAGSPAPTAATGGSMLAAVRAARWSSGVSVDVAADSFTIRATGLPDCGAAASYLVPRPGLQVVVPTSADQVMVAPNPSAAQSYSVRIPLVPVAAASARTARLGMIGITISGVAIFNPYEADGRTVALDNNLTVNGVPFIDANSGHPNQNRAYHYHGVPFCLVARVDVQGQHSAIVGFLLDGYPVYGPLGEAGRTPTNLDECGGHVGPTPDSPDGTYHYHFSPTTPYTFRCFHGTG